MFKEIKNDLPASIVVFFVALPLCLGIALASGVPLFSGIIAGIVGGIVVGIFSGSTLGVSGPAAGLVAIVSASFVTLGGSWNAFYMAVVIAGVFQILLGFAKAGIIAYFFPSSVIKGMLSGIGLLIILKQIPHALGWDKDIEGDDAFFQPDGQNTFSEIIRAFDFLNEGVLIISVVSFAIIILWDQVLIKKHKIFGILNGPLVVVVFGIIMSSLYQSGFFNFSLNPDQLVKIPMPEDLSGLVNLFSHPDFSAITNIEVWKTAAVIAVIASLETLLCVEATDKLDPFKRITPTNRELKAQGIGNVVSGLIGGLPITQVIVRSSANITFGGKTKMSTIFHGFFLLVSALLFANVLNLIPLSSLAVILIMVGYKLAKPSLFLSMYKLGKEQFIPFLVTIIAILATDLLKGISAGIVVGIFFTLIHAYRNSHHLTEEVIKENERTIYRLTLAEEVTFFNKAEVIKELESIKPNSKVIIDFSKSVYLAYDIVDVFKDYENNAKSKNIIVEKIYSK